MNILKKMIDINLRIYCYCKEGIFQISQEVNDLKTLLRTHF